MTAGVTTSRRGLWLGVALGTPLIGLTALDALTDAGDTHPGELARWIVGSALVVDLVVVPIALVGGRLTGQRAWLRWPLAATGTVALVAWPFVRGYGRSAGNPSLLPRDHTTGVLVAVAAVWAVAAAWEVRRRRARLVPRSGG